MKKIQLKMKSLECSQDFSLYKSARMKKMQLKMKALECPNEFSHYKSMGIFPDAQEQLILQSMIGSVRISNSSETLWLSSLPAKMKIRTKM